MGQGNNHNQDGNAEPGGAGQMMAFALIDQADRLGKSTEANQRALAAQIEKLIELRGQIVAAVQNLEAERGRLQSVGPALQQSGAHAMRLALQEQSDAIGTKVGSALRSPLYQLEQAAGQIERAAGQVRQNVRETGWLLILLYCMGCLIVGLTMGYLPLRGDVNALREQGDRIEQVSSRPAAEVRSCPGSARAAPRPGAQGQSEMTYSPREPQPCGQDCGLYTCTTQLKEQDTLRILPKTPSHGDVRENTLSGRQSLMS